MAGPKDKKSKSKVLSGEIKFQDLPWFERMAVRLLDHFQGYDTYDPKGNLKTVPESMLKLTPKQRAEWKEIDAEGLRNFDENPLKAIMNSEMFQQRHKNKGGLIKKKKKMNVGGLTPSAMQNGLSRKINPSTGLTMNKGGMTDYRKSGMFYGGGMARRGR